MAFEETTQKEYVAVVRRSVNSSTEVGGGKWSGAWIAEKRIIPIGYTKSMYGMGTASFEMVPTGYYDGSDPDFSFAPSVYAGSFIGIATLNSRGVPNDPEWVGYITQMPNIRWQSSLAFSGTIQATRLGAMLGQIPVKSWGIKRGDGTVYSVDTAPSANVTVANGSVIGNKVAHPTSPGLSDDLNPPLFANDPAECGTASGNYWTRHELIRHIIKYNKLNNTSVSVLPEMKLQPQGGSIDVLNEVLTEEVRLSDVTIKSALDILISRQRGLMWDIDVSGDDWIIKTYLTFDEANKKTLDLGPVSRDKVIELSVDESAGTQYDEIIVEGHPVVWMGTLENGTDNEVGTPSYFQAGWTTAQETAYIAASDDERKNNEYDDVFKRWIPKNPTGGSDDILYTKDDLGIALFCQKLSWDGASLSLAAGGGIDTGPYMPSAKILRSMPWQIGFSDDADSRSDNEKVLPKYAQPMMYNIRAGQSFDVRSEKGITVYVDDRGIGYNVKMSIGHAFAKELNEATFDGDDYSWEANAFTFAVESTQRVRITAQRPLDSGQRRTDYPIRKTLVIKGDWHCWCCHTNAIVGIKDGEPERTVSSGSYVVDNFTTSFTLRNDYALAQKALDEAKVWAFRTSKSARIVYSDLDIYANETNNERFNLGDSYWKIIDKNDDQDTSRLSSISSVESIINAAVESISVSCNVNAVSYTVNFGVPASVGAGGSSVTTIRNSIQSSKNREVEEIKREIQAIPVHTSKGGGGTLQEVYEVIIGQDLPPANLKGIKYMSSPVTLVDDDPEVAGDRSDGMGVAVGLRTGEKIMVVHDSSAPYGVEVALRDGDYGVSIATRTSAGGTVYHYLARF